MTSPPFSSVSGDARPVHERPVAAAQILEDEALGLAHDGGMARRDVEIALGVEADVGERVAADPDIRLAEGFDFAGARAGQELELRLHRANAR